VAFLECEADRDASAIDEMPTEPGLDVGGSIRACLHGLQCRF